MQHLTFYCRHFCLYFSPKMLLREVKVVYEFLNKQGCSQVAAWFWTLYKTKVTLITALERIKLWNTLWQPSVSMTDCDSGALCTVCSVHCTLTGDFEFTFTDLDLSRYDVLNTTQLIKPIKICYFVMIC